MLFTKSAFYAHIDACILKHRETTDAERATADESLVPPFNLESVFEDAAAEGQGTAEPTEACNPKPVSRLSRLLRPAAEMMNRLTGAAWRASPNNGGAADELEAEEVRMNLVVSCMPKHLDLDLDLDLDHDLDLDLDLAECNQSWHHTCLQPSFSDLEEGPFSDCGSMHSANSAELEDLDESEGVSSCNEADEVMEVVASQEEPSPESTGGLHEQLSPDLSSAGWAKFSPNRGGEN
jgi:hypothetical protein